jgi:hypothetical protein
MGCQYVLLRMWYLANRKACTHDVYTERLNFLIIYILCFTSKINRIHVKNVVLLDIEPLLVPHSKHIISPLQSPAGKCYATFEVFTAVTMKNGVFCKIKTQFAPHRNHCKIWGFQSGDYKECHLLGCYAVWLLKQPTFRRNLAPPSSGWEESLNKEQR